MRLQLLLLFILASPVIKAQNPLVGDWVGKYTLGYDDETFAHFPLPYYLSFTEDSVTVHYLDEFPQDSEEPEKLHYQLKKNIIEFHEDEDTFQILMMGINSDTLAIFGEDFDEGVMVFAKVRSTSKSVLFNATLTHRSFVLTDSKNKVYDTLEFYPGNTMLSYHSPNHWNIDNYQIVQLDNTQFLDLRSDEYSLLRILNYKKNEITLLSELNGSDTLTLKELSRPKKSSLTRTKWKFLSPEKPCNSIIAGFNDSLLIVTVDKKDILSHFYLSYNENFLLTLPENYVTYRNKTGLISASRYNLYRRRNISADQMHLYNQNRGIAHDPFVCGREFELRMVKTK